MDKEVFESDKKREGAWLLPFFMVKMKEAFDQVYSIRDNDSIIFSVSSVGFNGNCAIFSCICVSSPS